jgi:hypothetical protein
MHKAPNRPTGRHSIVRAPIDPKGIFVVGDTIGDWSRYTDQETLEQLA